MDAHDIGQSSGAPATLAAEVSLAAADEFLRSQPAVVVSLEAASVTEHAGDGEGPAASAVSLVSNTMIAASLSPVEAGW